MNFEFLILYALGIEFYVKIIGYGKIATYIKLKKRKEDVKDNFVDSPFRPSTSSKWSDMGSCSTFLF